MRNESIELRHIIAAGGTLAFNQLLQIAVPFIAVVVLGRLGVADLAAGSLVNSIGLLLYLTALGILQGVMPLVSTALGARDDALVDRVGRAGLIVALALGLITAAVMALVPTALELTGYDALIVARSRSYIPWLLPAYLPSLLFLAVRFFLVAVDDLRWLNPIAFVALAFNALLNFAFIEGWLGWPAVGIAGVAISATLTNWLMLTLIVIALSRSRRARLFSRDLFPPRWDPAATRQILAIGLPVGAILFTETMLFTGSSLLMGHVGARELAAHGLVLLWLNIALMVPVGISQAAVARVAFQVGRFSPGSAKQAARAAVVATALFSGALALLFAWCPELLIRLCWGPAVPGGRTSSPSLRTSCGSAR